MSYGFPSIILRFLSHSQTAIASSVIFKVVDAEAHNDPTNTGAFYGKNGVAWILRYGGLCTLVCYSVHLLPMY